MESDIARPLNIVIAQHDKADREFLHKLLLQSALSVSGVKFADSLDTAVKFLDKGNFDVVFLDLGLPNSRGVDLVGKLNANAPDVPIIVLSGPDNAGKAVSAEQPAAEDYLIKGQFDSNLLTRTVRYAIERRRAQKTLSETQKNINAIFDAAPVGMMLIDEHTIVQRVNNPIRQMLNKDDKKTINQRFGDALGCINTISSGKGCGNSPACELCQLHKAVDTILESRRSVHEVEIRPTFKVDGQRMTRWFRISGEPAIVNGCIHAVIAINDITESKTAQRERRLAEDKYRTIFENSAVAISLVDEQERLISWNKFTENLLGMSREDLYLKPVKTLYPEEQWQKMRSHNIRQKGMQHHMETQVLKKNGELIDVDISLSILKNPEGKVIGSIGVIRDIVERKKAERELKETMEIKSQFISTVSHELRTPLASMREAVAIVSDEMAGEINKEQKNFLDIAKRNADRLSRLIDEFLDFQRLSANKMRFHMQDNDIKEVVKDAYNTMAPYAKKKGVHLSTELDGNMPKIKFDNDRMIQVLINLISNAIKFTPENGQVSVRAQRQGEDLAIRISDTGMGMPKEDLPKIFEQFYRVNHPNRHVKGTGLGLTIVKKIVEVHRGRIEVDSEVDKGTTFTVFLPLSSETAPDSDPKQSVSKEQVPGLQKSYNQS